MQTVGEAWNSVPADPDPFRRIFDCLKVTARCLQGWGSRTTGNISSQLSVARELIFRLDMAQDYRTLSPSEGWLRRRLKHAYLILASLERSIARQRFRFGWLKEGDTNSAFFKIHAAHRTTKNRILQLRVEDSVVFDEEYLSQDAYEHFCSILGSSPPPSGAQSIRLEAMDARRFYLHELDRPFTEAEIWDAVKQLPTCKAPGPDGYTSEFLRACWPIIKSDICAAFDKLFSMNGRGFHNLNEALLILLPKTADASSLTDFRPISLIHIVAKLFAKVLSLRLAPRMGEIVSANQSAFIAERCTHDNFLLVQQTARLLHNLKASRLVLKLDIAKAFDTVSWPFLMESQAHLGFGRRWREWVSILTSSSTSCVLINGSPGPPIDYARGLRQGDSLSPMLFAIVIDTLNPSCSTP